jgi:hypothetical protein
MAKLGHAFALTDLSACYARIDADGQVRIRPMRMLVSLPESSDDGGCGPSAPPPEDCPPGSLLAHWLTALLATSARPSGGAMAPCPEHERDLVA